MEILNEINSIRSIMGLPILNEATGPTEIIVKVLDSTLKRLLTDSEKTLIRTFLTSPKKLTGQLGKDFETFIKSVNGAKFIKEVEKEIEKEVSAAKKLNYQSFLDSMKTFKAPSVATKKSIQNIMSSLEKSYPVLFKKNIFGNFVNRDRVDLVYQELVREFEGKTIADLVKKIEKELADANSKLDKIKMPKEKKNYFKKLLTSYGDALKKNTSGTLAKTVLIPPGIAIASTLLYKFFNNWYEQGDIIAGTTATGADIWGSIKKGWYAMKSYPDSPNGLLLYLNDKYGNKDWKKLFNYEKVGDIITLTPKSGGESKSFEHNGRTFIEL